MPISIYLRLIDYNKAALTSSGNLDTNIVNLAKSMDVDNQQFISVVDFSNDVVQTLSIGSQSAGAGAGKIMFNPLRITKRLDAVSPLLFKSAASGAPYKSAEILFVNAQNMLVNRLVYKLVAVKTIAWAMNEEFGAVENVEFEYGGQFLVVNKIDPSGKSTGTSQAGWNRIRNTADNDPESPIDNK